MEKTVDVKNGGEIDDEEDRQGYLWVFFRKTFDALPDRQKHVDTLMAINEDFVECLFDNEQDKEELHGMVKGSIHNVGEAQIKRIYEYLMSIPKIKKIFDEIDDVVPGSK